MKRILVKLRGKKRDLWLLFVEGGMCDEDAHKFFPLFVVRKKENTARSENLLIFFYCEMDEVWVRERESEARTRVREKERKKAHVEWRNWNFLPTKHYIKKTERTFYMWTKKEKFWVTTKKRIKVPKGL